MIKSLNISGVHSQITEDVRMYVQKKIGGLDTYIPRNARESASVEVKLKEGKARDGKIYECEVIMKLPKAKLAVHEKAFSFLPAVDQAEDNLKNQIKKYKDKHNSRIHRHIINRLRRKAT